MHPHSRKAIAVIWAALIALTVAVAITTWIVVDSVADTQSTAKSQQELIDRLAAAVDSAKAQGADVQTPEEIAGNVDGAEVSPVGPQGERGDVGPPGPPGEPGPAPTAAQVALAVSDYCALRDGCAVPPTDSEIESAVTAYCASHLCGTPGPAGASGSDGSAGRDGVDGTQGEPGPAGVQGPAGSPGPAGPSGANGTNGADGRTPSAMNCTPDFDGSWSCVVTAYQGDNP